MRKVKLGTSIWLVVGVLLISSCATQKTSGGKCHPGSDNKLKDAALAKASELGLMPFMLWIDGNGATSFMVTFNSDQPEKAVNPDGTLNTDAFLFVNIGECPVDLKTITFKDGVKLTEDSFILNKGECAVTKDHKLIKQPFIIGE